VSISTRLDLISCAAAFPTQTTYEEHFKTYIFIACYQKMYQCFTSWSTLGLIYNLAHFSRDHLDQVVSQAQVDTEEVEWDRSLANLLGNLPYLQKLVELDENLDIPVPDLLHLKTVAKDSGFVGVYPKDTAIDFHYFLVCFLIVFTRQLSEVSRGKLTENFITAHTVPCANALAIVAHSRTLLCHLTMLTQRGIYCFPISILRKCM
jgi:hypothetical protein